MRVLFICNQNLNRSKTAEHLFEKRFATRSAGLYNEYPVTKQQLLWADTIVVMEDEQRAELSRRFPDVYAQKKIISLGGFLICIKEISQNSLLCSDNG